MSAADNGDRVDAWVKQIGSNRNAPRIYLDGM